LRIGETAIDEIDRKEGCGRAFDEYLHHLTRTPSFSQDTAVGSSVRRMALVNPVSGS
jgi:hypothetical protein